MKREKIAVCISINDNYTKYARLLIKSFIINNTWFQGDIIILEDDYVHISDENFNSLLQFYPRIIRKHFNRDDKLNQLIEKFKPHLLRPLWYYSYLKLYMFNLYEYDKILWLDADIIINGDISKIFESDDDIDIALDADTLNTPINVLQKLSNTYLSDNYIEYDNEYCNAGVIYIGNKNFLNKLKTEFIDFCLNYEFKSVDIKNIIINAKKDLINGSAFEQDMLNLYLQKEKDNIRCKILPIKYNTSTSSAWKLLEIAKIVHYWTKPEVLLYQQWIPKQNRLIAYNIYKKYQNYMDEKIIITLTSWAKRIKNIPTVLDTIYNQTIKPDNIVINLSSEEFPNKENDLPVDVLNYVNNHNNIIINWVDGKNIKSWKKTIPTFKLFPNDAIICIDDDLLYKETFIETLWNTHLKYPNNPISYTIARINRYFIQHCGCGSLDKKCYYDNDIEKWLSTDITNFTDEDSFMTFMAVRHGNRPISCGHFLNVTTPYNNDNGMGDADLWKAYYWVSNVLNDKFENYIYKDLNNLIF